MNVFVELRHSFDANGYVSDIHPDASFDVNDNPDTGLVELWIDSADTGDYRTGYPKTAVVNARMTPREARVLIGLIARALNSVYESEGAYR